MALLVIARLVWSVFSYTPFCYLSSPPFFPSTTLLGPESCHVLAASLRRYFWWSLSRASHARDSLDVNWRLRKLLLPCFQQCLVCKRQKAQRSLRQSSLTAHIITSTLTWWVVEHSDAALARFSRGLLWNMQMKDSIHPRRADLSCSSQYV